MPDDIFGDPPIPPNDTAAWDRIHEGLHDYCARRPGEIKSVEDAGIPPGKRAACGAGGGGCPTLTLI